MNRNRWAMISTATLLALGGLGGIAALRTHALSGENALEARADGFRARWPLATELRYDLTWRTETNVRVLPSDSLGETVDSGGKSDVRGVLSVKALRTHGASTLLLVSFAELERANFVIEGADGGKNESTVDAMRAALVGPSAAIEVDNRGRLISLKTSKDAHAMFGDVIHALATELSFEMAEDDAITWETEERSMTGMAKNAYRTVESSDGGRAFERTRSAYTSLNVMPSKAIEPTVAGTTRLTFDDSGLLVGFEGGEEVRVDDGRRRPFETKTDLTLKLSSRVPFALAGVEEAVAEYKPHQQVADETASNGDRVLTKDFTRQDVAALIAAFSGSGEFPRGHLAKAAAYIRLHPEECGVLEAIFARDASARGRSMVIDVLSSAGSPEAQAAMIRILETPAAKHDGALHRSLLQRFAFVRAPTPDALNYVRGLSRSNDATLAETALVTTGSVLGRLLEAGDHSVEAEARSLMARAKGDLSNESAEGRLAVIMAIGNLSHPDASAALAAQSANSDPSVRAAVATALRHGNDPGAPKLLAELMKDPDPYVARSALEAHLGHPLTSAQLTAFADLVKGGGTNAEADIALATSLMNHSSAAPDAVRSILETLVARAPEDSPELPRLRAALQSVTAT